MIITSQLVGSLAPNGSLVWLVRKNKPNHSIKNYNSSTKETIN